MQLTSKNLMVGDYIKCFTRKELSNGEIVKVDVNCLKWAEENPEEFSKLTRPIPLTEDLLRKIELVECDCKSLIHSVYSIKNGMSFVFRHNNGDSYLKFYGMDMNVKHIHQLQQICRTVFGHELIINF